MKRLTQYLSFVIAIGMFVACNEQAKTEANSNTINFSVPDGWTKAGSHPASYNMGLDEKGGMDNGKGATIQSKDTVIDGFGTLMQNISAEKYKGKTIRLSGFMKSSDIKEWAGLWLRIDCAGERQGEFDNMQNRAVKGNTDWKRHEIVLHVDTGATSIAYGALLAGTGKLWFDKLDIEVVPDSTPSTNMITDQPKNLDFDK